MNLELKNLTVDSIKVGRSIRNVNENIKDLKKSIQEHGLLQPITVYLNGGNYIVKTGHRRFQAYQELCKEESGKFKNIPCIISDEKNSVIVQLVENIHRKNLKPAELCDALVGLRKQGMSNDAIAKVFGKSKGYVDNQFSILKELENNPLLKELATHVNMSMEDIFQTKGIPDEKRLELLTKRVNGKLTQKDLRKEVRNFKTASSEVASIISISGTNFKLDINIEISEEQRKVLEEKIKKLLEDFKTEQNLKESEAV